MISDMNETDHPYSNGVRALGGAAGPFHILVMQEADHWDQPFLHESFHVYHQGDLVNVDNKNTFETMRHHASMERTKSKKDERGIIAFSVRSLFRRPAKQSFSVVHSSPATWQCPRSAPWGSSCGALARTCAGATSTQLLVGALTVE